MPKNKKKFDENKNAVKFKLVYRSAEDPNYQKGTLADRVFQLIEDKKSLKANPVREAKKAKILSQFSDKDLGKYDMPRKIENFLIDGDDEHERQEEEEIPSGGEKKAKKGLKGIAGRADLWINQLNKQKVEAAKDQEKGKKVEEKKGKGDEEWEDCGDEDEEYEDIEIEEGEEDEEDLEEIGEEESKDMGRKEEKMMEILKKEKENQEKQKEKLPEIAVKMLEREDPINIPQNFEINPNIKMKYYDENGLLIDGYDYYQHIAKKNTEGVVAVVYNAEYEKPPELKPDLDYQPNEMTPEQREVFEALQYEGEDQAYENLEDNFVDIANCGEKCLDSKVPLEQLEQGQKKEMEEVEKELEDDEEELPDIPDMMTKDGFKKIVNEYIAHMEKKKGGKKVIEEEEEDEEQEEEEILESKQGMYIKRPDLKPENRDKLDPSFIVTKRTYDKLTPEEDICLQQYMNKESSDTDDSDSDDEKKVYDDSPTIEENSRNNSGIAPKLNIIKEKRAENPKRKNKKEKNKENGEENTEKEEKEAKKEINEVFKKRGKGETAEEKAERKAQIKAFKQERKEKKQKFKEELKNQNAVELRKNKPNHNINHVSIYKL